MINFLYIVTIFFIVGYTFSAILLLFLWVFLRKRLPVRGLMHVSNTAVAFYALCWVLLCIAEFIRVSHMGDFGKYRTFALESKFLSSLLITIAVAIPFLRKRPLWLLIPITLALNYGTISLFLSKMTGNYQEGAWRVVGAPDTAQILWGLESQEPFVLLAAGALYCLLIFLLYMLSEWAKRLVNTPPSS